MAKVDTLSREKLQQTLSQEIPGNNDERSGYALINVLSPEQHAQRHIPQSINIPVDEINEVEKRFAKDKEIIVYCPSPDCDASPEAAKVLAAKGFNHVLDYKGGLSDWQKAGNEIAGAHTGRC